MTELVGVHQTDTDQKALRINLDPRWYGTVAEIDARAGIQSVLPTPQRSRCESGAVPQL